MHGTIRKWSSIFGTRSKNNHRTFVGHNTASLQFQRSTAISGQLSAGGAILLQSAKPRGHGHQKQTNQTNEKRLTLSAITSVTFEIMKTTSPHSTQKKAPGSNHVRVVDNSIGTCGSPSIPPQSMKATSTHKWHQPTWGQSDDCQVPASSKTAFKVSALLFKNRISVKCYLSIVSHIRKTVVGAAMSWRSCRSGSRQTDFTTLPVTSAETNHHNRKKYQIHTYTNARSKKSTSTAQMGFVMWSDVTPHQSSVGKETR